ncbi:MAG: hypothetical protein KF752_19180 [Pirellulaceae bacterium]|nr:hypothetical protein [Pirellulaceae bacterium]
MEVHPLDREDDDDSAAAGSSGTPQAATHRRAHPQLLKLSTRAVLVCGALVLLTSVLTSNLTYGTPQWQTAFAVNRLSTTLLLFGFVGILAAYQMENLKRILGAVYHPRPSKESLPSQSTELLPPVSTGQSQTQSTTSPKTHEAKY